MKRLLWAAALLPLVGAGAWADEKGATVSGPPPTFLVVSMDKDGKIAYVATVVETRFETITREVISGGVKMAVTEKVPVSVAVRKVVTVDPEKAKARDVEGNKVDLKTLKKALAKSTPVLAVPPGGKIDKAYLAMFKKETLVLELPAAPGAIMPGGPVAPPPVPAPPPPPGGGLTPEGPVAPPVTPAPPPKPGS